MFSVDDTIVALATPRGRGAIGVVRLSGPAAAVIAAALLHRPTPLEPRRATLGRLRHDTPEGGTADEVVVTLFPAPHSYTGQDVVEIAAHGTPVVLDAVVAAAVAAGARQAEPGEFTLRAFLGGKCDLVQAEAVADLIDAVTPAQARTAFDQLEGTLTGRIAEIDARLFDVIARLEASLDFPDEGFRFVEPGEAAVALTRVVDAVDALLADGARGRVVREGARVVIAGRPNVGKSSLFNRLAGADRAIVTEVAGTTRDLVTERVDLDGLSVDLVDTAGWRSQRDVATIDAVEREGIARGERARAVADLTLVVVDRSTAPTDEDMALLAAAALTPSLVVANKADLPAPPAAPDASGPSRALPDTAVTVSAATGAGLDALRSAIVRALTGRESLRDVPAVSNARHLTLLAQARASLIAARDALDAGGVAEEFVLADLQAARASLDEIVGRRTSDDLLRHVFERFCVGK
jgi:tRNA modification GTPase